MTTKTQTGNDYVQLGFFDLVNVTWSNLVLRENISALINTLWDTHVLLLSTVNPWSYLRVKVLLQVHP